MLKLILKGGLGNQMFQYAALYSLSKQLATDYILDLSFIKNRLPIPGFTSREYDLNVFNLDLAETTLLHNSLLDTYISYPIEKTLFKLNLFCVYVERDPYIFDSKLFNIPINSYMEGYFNNYKYFSKYSSDILNIYNTAKLADPKFERIEKRIIDTNSVSINIRKGDYTNKKNSQVYVQLGTRYYQKAIAEIKKRIKEPHFFIFSYDDPGDFKSVLGLKPNEYTYLGKEYAGYKFKTYLRLISLCKHNIISNSTFAFWGAYLNKNKQKVVVCPIKWAKNGWVDFSVPSEWIGL